MNIWKTIIWTAEKDMQTGLIIIVIHATWAVVKLKLKPEKKFKKSLSAVQIYDFSNSFAFFIIYGYITIKSRCDKLSVGLIA